MKSIIIIYKLGEKSLNVDLEKHLKIISILYYMMKTNLFDLNNDILGKKNECLSIPICININDEEVKISKNLDRYSIIDIISKYNQDLASEINKMNIYEIECPKKQKIIRKFNYAISESI